MNNNFEKESTLTDSENVIGSTIGTYKIPKIRISKEDYDKLKVMFGWLDFL